MRDYLGFIPGETSEQFQARQQRAIEHESAFINALKNMRSGETSSTHAASEAAMQHEDRWINRNRDAQLGTNSSGKSERTATEMYEMNKHSFELHTAGALK